MLNTKITTNVFTALISEAFFAAVKQTANLDCAMWHPQESVTEEGTYTINPLLDYALNLKAFRSIGVHAVIVRFNIEFYHCVRNSDNNGFTCNDGQYAIWGGSNCNNFTFLDANGDAIEVDGKDGLYNTHFKDVDDEAVSVALIQALNLSMTDEELKDLLDNSLRFYNKLYKESLEIAKL